MELTSSGKTIISTDPPCMKYANFVIWGLWVPQTRGIENKLSVEGELGPGYVSKS